MSRLDWKKGRWTPDTETDEINDAIRGYSSEWGDHVEYYRFDAANSVMHDIYDEASGEGRVFIGPIYLETLPVIHQENPNESPEAGFYYRDAIHVTCSFDQFTKTGFPNTDIDTQAYLRDRLVYDNKVFRVTEINVLGQIIERDVIVTIDGQQIKPDELVFDAQFNKYSG